MPFRFIFDPRRSFATSIGWLISLLLIGLAGMTGWWEGDLARDSLLEQRSERAANAAQQWSSGLDAALAQRRQPLRTAAAMVPRALLRQDAERLSVVFGDLQAGYPELAWIGLADATGRLLTSTSTAPASDAPPGDVAGRAWFREGLHGAWIGVDPSDTVPARFIALAMPVRDAEGRAIGVIGARLEWRWLVDAAAQLRQRVPLLEGSSALLLDAAGRVLIGPPALLGRPAPPEEAAASASVPPGAGGSLQTLGWRVLLQWPEAEVTRRADAERSRIFWWSLGLGGVAALAGIALADRVTRRLTRLTASVQAVDPQAEQGIAVPRGNDEVSHLGRAFDTLLQSLRRERDALARLTAELEQRVQARTREVERLAEETRYAAVVRERLRIARDLHDTLAHSMMAMLAEVRILRRLHQHDPGALADELARAEEAAQQGLNEARAAILRMRFNGVRDLGLGPALADAIARFTSRTGLAVAYGADPNAAVFADTRAETVFRIAEEALRNIERHAAATEVSVQLRDEDGGQLVLDIADNGVGFDADAPHPGHYGLVGLREQAQLVGARLSITSAPGQGTRLRLSLGTGPDLVS
ncbi:hypothetical protein RD110_25120 [Rhodoferax koreense]|uniref:histidine kinase n=2 Tax=Rhodoferax koreensis TaxID=1842727 RepID=A0A1P8K4L9_9BURK|nr:hypothetical protein RD110_25120 [Rhodoferax koreense]